MIDLEDMKKLNGGKKEGVKVVCEPCVRTTPVVEPASGMHDGSVDAEAPYVPIHPSRYAFGYDCSDDYYRRVFNEVLGVNRDYRSIHRNLPLTTANTINRRNEK